MVFSQCIDFDRSRIYWNHGSDKSHGSFKVEAILRVFGASGDMEELFALGAGVIAGNMYAPGKLVKQPAYLFQIAASNDRHVIFRTYTKAKFFSLNTLFGKGREGDSYGSNQLFESLVVNLKSQNAKKLETSEGIESHYLRYADFSCLIKIPFVDNRRLELEFPVKHFNLHPTSKMFQVETGPILFVRPECLSQKKPDLLKELIPSFIHFNSFERANFSLDFPYGIRESSGRGRLVVEEMDCDIQLWVPELPNV
jgi:hypothetical protein